MSPGVNIFPPAAWPGSGGRSSGAASDPGYTVYGGVGSIRYVLEQMALAGPALQRVADGLAPLVMTVLDAATFLDRACLGVYSYPYSALEELRAAGAGCQNCQQEVQEIASEARTAFTRYEEAETGSSAAMAAVKSSAAYLGGVQLRQGGPFLAPWVLAAQAVPVLSGIENRGLRDGTEGAVNGFPEYLAGLIRLPLGLGTLLTRTVGNGGRAPEPLGVMAAGGLRYFLDRTEVLRPGQLELTQLRPADFSPGQGGSGPVAKDGSVGGVMATTLHDLYAGSRAAYRVAPGALVIKRVDRGDGTVAWIADLPGTEQWWPLDAANPWDVEGDLEALTAGQPNWFAQRQILVQEWLRAALAAAGAKTADPVMINAHSGGGIHAAAMAADPVFLAAVNVQIINIAGTPGANYAVAPGIRVLALENMDDIVAALDLRPPPDSAQWTTVTSDRRAGAWIGNPGQLAAGAHELDAYIADAARLDESIDPSVLAHKAAVLAFLGPAALTGAVAYRKFVYRGRDKSMTPQNPPQKAETGTQAGKQ
ncbi:hypothetical protein IV498_00320 [Paenarthrobacter sp. Z7-10]|uniref:hypothetical protein n=1 Tax=Paenarthrobacter sp. Z7-10 TaxID=2787635 RepID=UPI0022A9D75E|nr:hypothetical protein [Paenarthrobacter sp. Z7-10]MCZ2401667.1 hypothetical protein [Paenarthrobacter sp. Z7-10]